jgi:hypothetical protein
MPTQNPRINVVLDDNLYQSVRFLAEKDSVSLSAKIRDLVKEALEVQEDIALAAIAEKREETLCDAALLSHEEAWS